MVMALACCLTASAQKGFHAGIMGGAINSTIIDKNKYGDIAYDYKMTIKPVYGIEAGYMWNDMWGMQAEADYTFMGQQYRNIPVPGSTALLHKEYSLNYLTIPVMFTYTGGAYRTRFSMLGGVAFNFLTSATETAGYQKDDPTNPVMTMPEHADVTSHFKATDMGLIIGAGGNTTIYKNLYLSIELRLYYGFNIINKDPQEVMMSNEKTQENEKLQNASIGLSLGLHNIFSKDQ